MSIMLKYVKRYVHNVKNHEKKIFFLSNRQTIQIGSTRSPIITDNDNSKKVNLAKISYKKKFHKEKMFTKFFHIMDKSLNIMDILFNLR